MPPYNIDSIKCIVLLFKYWLNSRVNIFYFNYISKRAFLIADSF